MEIVRIAIAMVLGMGLPFAVELWDRRTYRDPAGRWSTATWGAAVFWLSAFSLLGWSWVTRRGFRRFVWGPAWFGGIFAALHTVDILVHVAYAESLDGWQDGFVAALFAVPIAVVILLFVMIITFVWRGFKRLLRAAIAMLPAAVAIVVAACVLCAATEARAGDTIRFGPNHPLPPGPNGWAMAQAGGVRGITVGPIENRYHPGVGYGTEPGRAAIEEVAAMGGSWVALTPFGRVWDLTGKGVDLVFEEEAEQNRVDVLRAIEDAHDAGLKVMLVPHLWVESGGWRAQIDPPTEAGWDRWAASYRRFLLHWADVAEEGQVEILSVGVELRSWVTTPRARSFKPIIADVRARFGGLLTYSGNWDDIEHTVILGEIDLIGVNAFYPLTKKEGASLADLRLGGLRVAGQLEVLATDWNKPVLLTEMGYTTRPDPALRPWEWPDAMENVVVDEAAQARAYRALLTPLFDEPWCIGFFVWRTYADPHDVSQEAAWGFSPRGKLAELELRDAFAAHWAVDPHNLWASWAGLSHGAYGRAGPHRARTPGQYGWALSPSLDELMR